MKNADYAEFVRSTSRVDPDYIAKLFGPHPDDIHYLEGGMNAGQQLLAAVGMAGEAGEFLEHYKKWLFHKKPLDMDALVKEAGDILWYLTLWGEATGHPLEYIMIKNKEKLDARRAAKERQFREDAA